MAKPTPNDQAEFKPFRQFSNVDPAWAGVTYRDLAKPLGLSEDNITEVSNTLTSVTTLGVGTSSPTTQLEVASQTSPQFKITYDLTHYATFGVDSAGILTITPTGSSETRISYLTQGSVLFAGANGKVEQNNASFFWDNVNGVIQVPRGWIGNIPANTSGIPAFTNGVDQVRLGEGRALGNPTGTIVATPSAGGLTGVYQYCYVEMDQSGNLTGFSPITNVTASSNQYTLTIPRPRSGVLARVVCRTKAGGATFYQIHSFTTGQNFNQTSWVDNTADGSLVTAVANVDSTKLYKITTNNLSAYGAIMFSTHPDNQSVSYGTDVDFLTGDPTTGTLAIASYGGISAQTELCNGFYSLHTGTVSSHLQCDWLSVTDTGQALATVFTLSPQGAFTLAPNTTGITNPSWFKLTGGIAGNYIVARKASNTAQAGLYVGTSFEPYFGGNIVYSGGDTYSYATTPPWRIGNPGASTTQPFELDVAVTGAAGAAITWIPALTTDTLGNILIPNMLKIGTTPATTGGIGMANNQLIYYRNAANNADLFCIGYDASNNLLIGNTTGSHFFANNSGAKIGFFAATPVVKQTRGATFTNNITVGGTTDSPANWTDLTTYATDAAAIRNFCYQVARVLVQYDTAFRASAGYGLLT